MRADYHRAVAEHTIDLLMDGSELAGIVETILRPDPLWIENVAVAPERQGSGHGRLLMPHVAKRALEAKRFEIRRQTNQAFVADPALYAKLAYAVDHAEPFRGGEIVHMGKRIEP